MEKNDQEPKQTMYDGRDEYYEDSRKTGRRIRRGSVILLVLLGLVLAYLLRNGLWFLAIKNTLEQDPQCHVVAQFNWLHHPQRAVDRLLNESRMSNTNLTVVLLVPRLERAHLYYFSKKNDVMINLGFMSVWTRAGTHELVLYGPDLVRQTWYGNHLYTYFGNTLLDPLFVKYQGLLENRHPGNLRSDIQATFVTIPYDTYLFFRLLFSLYLVVPFIIIILMVLRLGRVMYIAFLYYGIMALLFNVHNLFYSSTFGWLFSLLKVDLPDFFPLVFIILLFLILAWFIYRGFQRIYRDKLSFEKVMYILLFILLPLVLRM